MSEIYAAKHQLNAVQARIQFFDRLLFNPVSIYDEVERLKRMEEILIRAVDADNKQCQ